MSTPAQVVVPLTTQPAFITLQAHMLAEERRFPGTSGHLSWIVSALAIAAKTIAAKLKNAGIENVLGEIGGYNVQGERQQKLDVIANHLLIQLLGQREGVAVIGSVLASTYGHRIGSFLSGLGLPLPQSLVDAASNNIGAVKNSLLPALDRAGAADLAGRVDSVADQAFVSAVHWGVLVAAAATAIGVVMVLVWLPARGTPADQMEQDIEFVDQEIADRVVDPSQV